jgi:hypothetical protein
LARAVTAGVDPAGHVAAMTRDEHARIDALLAAGRSGELDDFMRELHRKYHDRPLDHVRVHHAWLRTQLARKRYAHALFHAFAGYVVAAPASLVQRYTGLAVPAFDARRRP